MDRPLVSRVAHIAVATRDLERLTAFYRDVFDAHDPYGRSAGDRARRLGFIAIGDATFLHVFEQPDSDQPLSRGRIDHFSLEAADPEAFGVIRDRLLARGASDGAVIDFGPLVSVFFVDPDGFQCEVSLTKPPGWDPPFDTISPRAQPRGVGG